MALDDTINSIAGIIPLVVVSGVAMKMTESMFGGQKQATVEEKPVKKSKKQKKAEGNAYTRERYAFGNNENSPF